MATTLLGKYLGMLHKIISAFSEILICAQVASRGDIMLATTLLGKYLSMYANDEEAWEELASLYLQVSTSCMFCQRSRQHWCG